MKLTINENNIEKIYNDLTIGAKPILVTFNYKGNFYSGKLLRNGRSLVLHQDIFGWNMAENGYINHTEYKLGWGVCDSGDFGSLKCIYIGDPFKCDRCGKVSIQFKDTSHCIGCTTIDDIKI